MTDHLSENPAGENSFSVPGKIIADQHRASNPAGSAWVSANAGSGKTFVLAQRVIRLMLNGVAPAKILCLTFTKAAAAEMANRVFQKLSDWGQLDDQTLVHELAELGEFSPNAKKLRMARLLFTRALETPGGLKIQTIHAFCEALLHQFTLEANTSGHFEIIDDYTRSELLQQARQATFAETLRDPTLADALTKVMAFGSDDAIKKGLDAITGMRREFANWLDQYALDIDHAISQMGRHLNIEVSASDDNIIGQIMSELPISNEFIKEVGLVAAKLNFKECNRVSELISQYAQAKTQVEKFQLRLKIYQTDKSEFRKKIPGVKALYVEIPTLEEKLEVEKTYLQSAEEKYKNWKMLNGSSGLFKLADFALQHYGHAKRARGLLDYDDLVDRTADLLARSDVRQWVQYKLDQGIDHVLVDEAQDTSPAQWQIINAIIEDYFATNATDNSNIAPQKTIFAVGDQKQSIYSFQGAEPEMFAQQKTNLNKRAETANHTFAQVTLPISFRSTRDVLSAVDKVFANPRFAKGLQDINEPILHEPVRQSDPGEVEIWPMFTSPKTDPQQDWLVPVDHRGEDHPTLQLANKIADTIKGWITQGKTLPGQGRKISFGDILILVRKRDRFASAITYTLKQAGLTVAGADRLNLASHIAVEDLLSLAKWALFPEDDLSLAEILKSPLFQFKEDDLFSVCERPRDQSLWQALKLSNQVTPSPLLQNATDQLANYRNLSQTLAPFEFYTEILSTHSGRKKFKARLGDEVDDVLDAFLLEALNHTRNGGSGLQEFILAIQTSSPDIKREMDLQKDEIRVMTVHSAKGLEAPIVFLVDPGNPASNANHRPPILKVDCDASYPALLWQPSSRDGTQITEKIHKEIREKAEEEYRRLLYVGMTRAEDKLVLCGYKGRTSGKHITWHEMVSTSLEDDCESIPFLDEQPAHRWIALHRLRKPRPIAKPPAQEAISTELPDWINQTPIAEFWSIPPLAPSVAASSIEATFIDEPSISNENFPLQRGNATHYLLQVLPQVDVETHHVWAMNYLQSAFPHWLDNQYEEVTIEVLQILRDDQFSELFAPGSQAEISLTGVLDPTGLNRRVNGQIDRLVVDDNHIKIVDFKTNRQVPEKIEDVADQYLVQLAIYRELLLQIYPEKKILCGLLWTRIPKITQIPEPVLIECLENWLSKQIAR